MKAVALNYETHRLEEMAIEEPQLAHPDDVLLRIIEVGICGTDRDLAAFRLAFPPPSGEYLVLGHECVAEVLRPGPGAQNFNPGDIVTPLVRRACQPPCSWCARGRRDRCASGKYTERGIVGAHGYFTELAIDRAVDLVPVPFGVKESAVLIEPLSVVEKAVATGLRLHPDRPEDALVIGAGPIGLLAVMTLRVRGLAVDVCSIEPAHSARARMVEGCEARYLTTPESQYDLVIEASGSTSGIASALGAMGPNGVLVLLGVARGIELPVLQLIVKNQAVVGSVNSSPADFLAAVRDLERFPSGVLSRLIEREPWSSFRSTLTGPLRPTPKIVHVVE